MRRVKGLIHVKSPEAQSLQSDMVWKSDRGPRNSSWQGSRGTGLTWALSTTQVTVRISSAKFPEGTIDGVTAYLHLPDFGMELKGREIFSSSLHCDSAHTTFGSIDLTSTYSACTRGYLVASGIETRPSGLESDALTTRLPTAQQTSDHGHIKTIIKSSLEFKSRVQQ
ncbi:hypothetical protein TNCV_168571 [Trichonephila clavipes]|nr:hypothetical protein TNCV_168571 [Trichonephila clavipes]